MHIHIIIYQTICRKIKPRLINLYRGLSFAAFKKLRLTFRGRKISIAALL